MSTQMMHTKKGPTAAKSYSLGKSNTNLKLFVIPAIGWTLGIALKSIIDSTVFDLIEPFAFKILFLLQLHKIDSIKNLIPKQERTFRISHFLSSLLSFIFIVYIVIALLNYYY